MDDFILISAPELHWGDILNTVSQPEFNAAIARPKHNHL